MGTVLVALGEPQWMTRAMHLACAMAHSSEGQVIVLVPERARSLLLLGSEAGMRSLNANERATILNCAAIANEYGLSLTMQPMQYDTLNGALAQAAAECEAQALFAQVPHSRIPLAGRYARRYLRRQMAACGCKLMLLDEPPQSEPWMPSVSLKVTR